MPMMGSTTYQPTGVTTATTGLPEALAGGGGAAGGGFGSFLEQLLARKMAEHAQDRGYQLEERRRGLEREARADTEARSPTRPGIEMDPMQRFAQNRAMSQLTGTEWQPWQLEGAEATRRANYGTGRAPMSGGFGTYAGPDTFYGGLGPSEASGMRAARAGQHLAGGGPVASEFERFGAESAARQHIGQRGGLA